MVKDELQALQLAYTSLEEKHRKVQEENRDLVSEWDYVVLEVLSNLSEICFNNIYMYVLNHIFVYVAKKLTYKYFKVMQH